MLYSIKRGRREGGGGERVLTQWQLEQREAEGQKASLCCPALRYAVLCHVALCCAAQDIAGEGKQRLRLESGKTCGHVMGMVGLNTSFQQRQQQQPSMDSQTSSDWPGYVYRPCIRKENEALMQGSRFKGSFVLNEPQSFE